MWSCCGQKTCLEHTLYAFMNNLYIHTQNLQNQVERLENLITELNNKLGQAEIQSASLSAEKTHLMQENAQLNLVNGELEKQVQSLQDASQECDLLQQDLSHVLDVVKDGVTEGTLKVSVHSI